MDLPRRAFAGFPVIAAPARQIIDVVISRALSGEGCDVHLLESNGIATAERSSEFENLLTTACMVIPDGRWLELLTRRSPVPLTQCRGEDLFRAVCDRGRESGLRHFLVGSTEDKVEASLAQLTLLYPGIEIAGYYCPPFRALTREEESELSQQITSANPHIVWMGISTPRQDFEARRIAQENSVVAIAVGAAFEFVSGHKKTSPRWMSRWGLEWLFRLLSEPRRLAKRYLVGNFLFAIRYLRHRRSDALAVSQQLSQDGPG